MGRLTEVPSEVSTPFPVSEPTIRELSCGRSNQKCRV